MTRPTLPGNTATVDPTADTLIMPRMRSPVVRSLPLRHWRIAAGCAVIVLVVSGAALMLLHHRDDGTGSTSDPATQVMYTIRMQGDSP